MVIYVVILKTYKRPTFEFRNSLIKEISEKYDSSWDGISSILSALKDHRDYITILFDDDENLLGVVSYYVSPKSASIQVDHIGTIEQQKGYGSLLMEKVFRTAFRLQKSVSLVTNGSSNEFYEKLGMTKISTKLPLSYEISIDDLCHYCGMKDPCQCCQYQTQACAYIMDGNKFEDACMTKRVYLKSFSGRDKRRGY